MTLDLVFVVLLLGHIVGDFYLQTGKIAKNKDICCKYMVWHGILYAMCMLILMTCSLHHSDDIWKLTVFVSSLHFFIDILKSRLTKIPKHIFTIDQSLHLTCLFIGWYIWGRGLTVQWFIAQKISHLPAQPITIILAILCVLRPVGIYIDTGEVWSDFNKQQKTTELNAGQVIGYLERIIILLFLLYSQFGAIAFVLTAKSVARYKEIETNKIKAEYYLIGTLTSVVSVFIIALLLGICGNI